MNSANILQQQLSTVAVNEDYTEAVMTLKDGTRLCFCHRVGERWAKSVGPESRESEAGQAGELLELIALFRLNSKHLDITFQDDSRWDEPLRA